LCRGFFSVLSLDKSRGSRLVKVMSRGRRVGAEHKTDTSARHVGVTVGLKWLRAESWKHRAGIGRDVQTVQSPGLIRVQTCWVHWAWTEQVGSTSDQAPPKSPASRHPPSKRDLLCPDCWEPEPGLAAGRCSRPGFLVCFCHRVPLHLISSCFLLPVCLSRL
jgi:hypothetical protein